MSGSEKERERIPVFSYMKPLSTGNAITPVYLQALLHRQGHVARVRLLRRRADDELQNRAECDVSRAAVADDRGRDLLYSQLCTLQTSEDFGTEADGQ